MNDSGDLDVKDVLGVAETWRAAGRGVALATVVETWGSAPRPVGSHLAVDEDGNFEGSVSGGCVEGAVIADALERGIPVLIAIPTCNLDSWRAFAGDLAGEITAETLAGTLRGPHHAVDIERVLAPPA